MTPFANNDNTGADRSPIERQALRTPGAVTVVGDAPLLTQAGSVRSEASTATDLSPQEIADVLAGIPGGAANVQDIYALTPLQRGMLFHHVTDSDGDAYVRLALLSFASEALAQQFFEAFQRVVGRHDALRTSISWEHSSEPVQVVHRQASMTVERLQAEGPDAAAWLLERFAPERSRLDVRHAPMICAHLAHDPARGRWLGLVRIHHMVDDATSLRIVWNEIRQVMADVHAVLPPTLPYRAFVEQMRAAADDPACMACFRTMLADVCEVSAPFGISAGEAGLVPVEDCHMSLPDNLACAAFNAASAQDVSVAILFHLAWALVLGCTSSRADVVFGTVLRGRTQAGVGAHDTVGLFINTLPLRIRLGTASVRDGLRETRAAVASLRLHEQAQLADVQRCSGIVAPAPLLASLLNYRRDDVRGGRREIHAGVQILGVAERTHYPFTVSVDECNGALDLHVQAPPSAGAARVAELLVEALRQLVRALDTRPDTPLGDLDILPGVERQRVLREFNPPAPRPADGATVTTLFEAQAARTPDAPAVVFGDHGLSYAQLDAAAARCARALVRLGVRPGERVAACLERGPGLVVGLLGILKAGAAYVPVDPEYPQERARFMLADCAPRAVVADRTELPLPPGVPVLRIDEAAALWRDHDAAENLPGPDSGLPAYVIYTSGSTGRPKGVEMSHAALVNLIRWHGSAHARLRPSQRTLQFAALGFDVAFQEIFTALCGGECLVIADAAARHSLDRLVELVRDQRVQRLYLPYVALQGFAEAANEMGAVLPALRDVITAGEALRITPELRRFFSVGQRRLHNHYGPTESHVVTAHTLEGSSADWPALPPIGRPLEGTAIYILDEARRPVPVGVAGEIHIGGAQVARGYLNQPALTAERFVADPFTGRADARMYRTGDLARWCADGTIEFIGRNDHQVKIRGFRVELGEIEARATELAGVSEAVVLAREDRAGQHQLVVYCRGAAAPAQVREHLARTLPSYMVPAAVVMLEALPLTPNGKVNRAALPAPDEAAYEHAVYEAPRGEAEELLAALWQELLGVPQVGRHDNFFSLGGHSLLTLRLCALARQRASLTLDARAALASPVLSDMARSARWAHTAATAPITARDREGVAPMSSAQRRLWLLEQLDVAAQAGYRLALGLRLRGTLDADALRSALDRIVMRHDVLRTRFELQDGVAVQRMDASVAGWPLEIVDLSEEPTEARLEARLDAAAAAGYDPANARLVRGVLCRLSDDDHMLWLGLHHLVTDGRSLDLLREELFAQYERLRRTDLPALPPLPLQYADYAAWQQEGLQSEGVAADLAFWKDHLAGAPASITLPFDRPRPPVQEYPGGQVDLVLDEHAGGALRAAARRHCCTPFVIALAAWSLLLARLSAQDDMVVGVPVSNRPAEFDAVLGMFVDTLALRIRLEPGMTGAGLVAQVAAAVHAGLAHQRLPFDRLVEALAPARDRAHAPIFQVMLSWQDELPAATTCAGLDVTPLPACTAGAKVDLELVVAPAGDEFRATLIFATSLFDRAKANAIGERWRRLLADLIEHPEAAVHRLALMTSDERAVVLARSAPPPVRLQWQGALLHHAFEANAKRAPQAPALVFGGHVLGYGELNARANRLARHLVALGVRPDDRVGVCAERGFGMVLALLATLKAGAAYVPLEPQLPAERLAFMLGDAGVGCVLADRRGLAVMAGLAPASLLDLDNDCRWRDRDASDLDVATTGVRPEHLAYVLYTSGSTGRPKGVMNEHGAIINRLAWMQQAYDLETHEAVLQKTPFGFDVSVWEFFWPLSVGARLVLAHPEGHKDPQSLAALIEAHAVTTVHFVPSMLQAFLDGESGAEGGASLRRVVCSGEALPASLARRAMARWPGARLHNLYGPTEAAVDVTAQACDALDLAQSTTVPIGRPIANTAIYILDGEGQLVPEGVTGEIHIAGVQVARGYIHRPDLTAQRFVPDPFGPPGGRMYRTGDLGRWRRDGAIDYLGRNDHQVKIRGLRIELGEIEARLAEAPGVREAVVLARPDRQGQPQLVAYCCAQAEPAGLREHLARALPSYMVPAAIVMLDAMPLTANGKLDRAALPAPEASSLEQADYAPAMSDAETVLAALWEELLGVPRVGRHDNFFSLGGHSLLAITMIARLRARGLALSASAVFETPTVAGLAAGLQGPGSPPATPHDEATPEPPSLATLPAAQVAGIVAHVDGGAANLADVYPLAPLQEGLLFHHLWSAEVDAYIDAIMFRLDTRELVDGFLQALQSAIDRHDVLRTAAAWEGLDEPVQVLWRKARLPVEVRCYETGDVMRALQEDFLSRPPRMDLRTAPLLRAIVAPDPSQGRWLLLLCLHHFIMDNTSLVVLLAEVRARMADPLVAPPPAAPRFRDFVRWRHAPARRLAHERYFRSVLGSVSQPTAPFGILDVRGNGAGVQSLAEDVPAPLAARLRTAARRLNVSAASLFHLAFAHVLSRVCGRDDVVLGTVLFGRMHLGAEADTAQGVFINTLPLRVTIGDLGVADAVDRVHRSLVELLRHEDASLALAQRCSGVPAQQPLFTALLNYRHAATRIGTNWPGVVPVWVFERTTYPLGVCIDDSGDAFTVHVQAVAEIGAARVGGHLVAALAGLADALEHAPDRRLRDVSILSDAERTCVLRDFNPAPTRVDAPECVHTLIERQVLRTPSAVAVVDDAQSLTYAELDARAEALAARLAAFGLAPDECVALALPRNPTLVVALLAVLKAGAAYVPLDLAQPPARLQRIVDDCAARLVLADAPVALTGVPLWRLDAPPPRATRALHARARALPHHLAYVIYTSGSTGTPKGVMVEHRHIAHEIRAIGRRHGLGPGQRVLQFVATAFDVCAEDVLATLAHGATLVLAGTAWRQDPQAFTQQCARHGVTAMNLPAQFWQETLLEVALPATLERIVIGGEAPSAGALRRWFGRGGHRPALCNAYGPTEATVCATLHACRPDEALPPIGRPLEGTAIYILDEARRPVPVGVAGEIHIGGAQVARGYLNQPALTAERFVADPFTGRADARMYRTGDLARWCADGTIEFIGRNDHQVKIRGFRVELGEIEARATELAGVSEAVVLAREDRAGQHQLVVYCRGAAAPAQVREHLARTLPSYMVPAAVVMLEALPLTPNGKVNRAALPAPDEAAYEHAVYEAPRGEAEELLAALWQELLGVPQVGRHDNFFSLGGHSLLALRLLERCRRMDWTLTLSALFEHPTLAGLAALRRTGSHRQETAVTLRAGTGDTILHLVPAVSGEPFPYAELARRIDPTITVDGLVGERHADASATSIQALAQRYAAIVQRRQPEGPVHLGGWSLGGLLAYETGAWLTAAGRQVLSVFLLDAFHPALMPHALRPVAPDGEGRPDVPSPALQAAVAAHTPTSAPLKLVLLRSAGERMTVEPFHGWNRVVPAPDIECVDVPGGHYDLLQAPHVAMVARHLSSRLRAGAAHNPPNLLIPEH